MDIKSFIGMTHSHTFQYFKQDPETGGYEYQLSKGGTFTPLSPKQAQLDYLAKGGWARANIPVLDKQNPYVSSILVPKLEPLVMVNGVNIIVGSIVIPTFCLKPTLYQQWASFLDGVAKRVNDIKATVADLDKEGWPRDPVGTNRREMWVEKAMWQMGMPRSKYKPTFAERFPHVGSIRLYPRDGEVFSEF